MKVVAGKADNIIVMGNKIQNVDIPLKVSISQDYRRSYQITPALITSSSRKSCMDLQTVCLINFIKNSTFVCAIKLALHAL
jgi:hypothetical protein